MNKHPSQPQKAGLPVRTNLRGGAFFSITFGAGSSSPGINASGSMPASTDTAGVATPGA